MYEPSMHYHRRCGVFGQGWYLFAAHCVSVFLVVFLAFELLYAFTDPPSEPVDTVECVTFLDPGVRNVSVHLTCVRRYHKDVDCGRTVCKRSDAAEEGRDGMASSLWRCIHVPDSVYRPIFCETESGEGCRAVLEEWDHSAARYAYAGVLWPVWGLGMLFVLFVHYQRSAVTDGVIADMEAACCGSRNTRNLQ